MSETRFLPLTCEDCGGDLTGRAVDLLAFCHACGIGWRCDEKPRVRQHVSVAGTRDDDPEILIHLPFWRDGQAIHPAFLSARPLTLARVVSEAASSWPIGREMPAPPPYGARISPRNLAGASRLALLSPSGGFESAELLAIPCVNGRRLSLPHGAGELYPEDVLELDDLLAMSGSSEGTVGAGR